MTRPVVLAAGAVCLALAGCSSSPRPTPAPSPAASVPGSAPAASAPAPSPAGSAPAAPSALGSGAALPAYSGTVLLPPQGSTQADGFGTLIFTGSGATTCSFHWATQHPFGWSGTAQATIGSPVTLHAFRDARLTLTQVTAEGCSFDETLPAQVENTASPTSGG